MNAAVKSLLLVACTGLVLGLATVAPATAAKPCWRMLIDDWYDGKIDNTYPPACYRQALKHLPQDVTQYSSAKDDIERALLAVLRGGNGSGGSKTPGSVEPDRTTASASPSESESSHKGVILRSVEWLGPADAASIPTPLLILAGVAFLLLAAAGGSFVNRRLQERRLPPPQ
jgi:hypothetical protein